MIIEKPSDFSTDLFLKAQEKAICHDYGRTGSDYANQAGAARIF